MKNSDAEALLLSNASLEDLIKMKIEKEFMNDLKKFFEDLKKSKEKPIPKTYTNIKDLSKDKIFSKYSIYKFFNRKTGCETFINGIQADALIGLQTNVRSKMLKGELNAFTTDDAYIKFEKAEY